MKSAVSRLRPPHPTADQHPSARRAPDASGIRPADGVPESQVDPNLDPTVTAGSGDRNNPLWVITAALAVFLAVGAALAAG